MNRNTGNQGIHTGGEAKGRQCSEQGVGRGGVRDMVSLGQDGVLSVAEVEEVLGGHSYRHCPTQDGGS